MFYSLIVLLILRHEKVNELEQCVINKLINIKNKLIGVEKFRSPPTTWDPETELELETDKWSDIGHRTRCRRFHYRITSGVYQG